MHYMINRLLVLVLSVLLCRPLSICCNAISFRIKIWIPLWVYTPVSSNIISLYKSWVCLCFHCMKNSVWTKRIINRAIYQVQVSCMVSICKINCFQHFFKLWRVVFISCVRLYCLSCLILIMIWSSWLFCTMNYSTKWNEWQTIYVKEEHHISSVIWWKKNGDLDVRDVLLEKGRKYDRQK